MCGFLSAIGNFQDFHGNLLKGLKVMSKRGPDNEGVYKSDTIWLGHRRLAIIDLDSRSNQPFQSSTNRYWITYNGEIYNYKILRDYLVSNGCNLRTNSDTEVILELYILKGVQFLSLLEGMFAFVIWDSLLNTAFIARDAYGIKPLYFTKLQNGLIFASQVKAILATNLVGNEINVKGLVGYWMLGSIPDCYTLYNDIETVTAGEYMIVQNNTIIKREKWCQVGAIWLQGMNEKPLSLSKLNIINNVKKIIIDSVERHLVADVPIGIFLSGGIDSGVLSGLIKERSKTSVIGITIAFKEFLGQEADESHRAKIIANHFEIKHHIRIVTKEEFISDLPLIFESMDQPSIDGINTWYASKAAAELGLKVVISGIGGDELFLGYNNFKRLPRLVFASRIINNIKLFKKLSSFITGWIAQRTKNERWKFFTEWSQTITGAWWLSRSIMSPTSAKSLVSVNGEIGNSIPADWIKENSGELSNDLTIALAQIESTMYLRNQLLKDSDWASMFHSIELRTPFVDLKLLMELRPYIKLLKTFRNKQLLYESLSDKKLPIDIINRKKTGFSIPINKWINEYTVSDIGWHKYVGKNFIR
jgi:asparagine synthase (glutamine-hydrolysing)